MSGFEAFLQKIWNNSENQNTKMKRNLKIRKGRGGHIRPCRQSIPRPRTLPSRNGALADIFSRWRPDPTCHPPPPALDSLPCTESSSAVHRLAPSRNPSPSSTPRPAIKKPTDTSLYSICFSSTSLTGHGVIFRRVFATLQVSPADSGAVGKRRLDTSKTYLLSRTLLLLFLL
jgi:hypothetical protein